MVIFRYDFFNFYLVVLHLVLLVFLADLFGLVFHFFVFEFDLSFFAFVLHLFVVFFDPFSAILMSTLAPQANLANLRSILVCLVQKLTSSIGETLPEHLLSHACVLALKSNFEKVCQSNAALGYLHGEPPEQPRYMSRIELPILHGLDVIQRLHTISEEVF